MMPVLKKRFTLKMIFFFCVNALLLPGCGSGSNNSPPPEKVKFAVMSDTHLYDGNNLGTDSPEFIENTLQENKLLAESGEILSAAIKQLSSADIDFVLITGDLTKDGERSSHELMAAKLAELTAQGRRVFVIPGNHDINNPLALSYSASPPSAVAHVTPVEFEHIYASFGYRDALFRDPDSLSYIAETVPGMWLFALDSCQYADNMQQGSPTTSGAFSDATGLWIMAHLKEAKKQGKVVIGMMHHGILEHLTGQSRAYPEYLLANWLETAEAFSENGLQIVFTGHFHANDVTRQDFKGSSLYDIETGSLVTYPNSYRSGEYSFNRNELAISMQRITSIPAIPSNFEVYSQKTSRSNLREITKQTLSMPPYNLLEPALTSASQMLAAGLMAHYSGNEAPGFFTLTSIQALMDSTDQAARDLGQALFSLWTDLNPMDNTLTILLAERF